MGRPLFRGGNPSTARTVFLVTLEHFADRVAVLLPAEQEAHWDRLSRYIVGLPATYEADVRLLEAKTVASFLPAEYGTDIDIEKEESP